MALLTYPVVRRHMKGTSGFTLCDEANDAPVNLSLTEGESVIGWYRNPAPWEAHFLSSRRTRSGWWRGLPQSGSHSLTSSGTRALGRRRE